MRTPSKIVGTFFAMVLLVGVANASPLAIVSVLGRVTGSGNSFSSAVIVSSGQSVDYQLVVQMAPIGTTNTQGTATKTITSLTVGSDGMNSTKHSIVQLSSATGIQANLNQALTFTNGWSDGPGDSGGTPTIRSGINNDLLGVRPIQDPGVFSGIAQEVIGSAVMQIASMGDNSQAIITARFFQGSSGSVKINGSTALLFSNSTENGANPMVGYNALTLLPEPTSVGMLGMGMIGVATRRRRRQ